MSAVCPAADRDRRPVAHLCPARPAVGADAAAEVVVHHETITDPEGVRIGADPHHDDDARQLVPGDDVRS
jgi:hypothetical protein